MSESYDKVYCYPNTNVLKNKLNIKDPDKLAEKERFYSMIRFAEIKNKVPVKGSFDLKHMQSIHKYLFQDLYDWAGEIRTVNIAKNEMFCNSMFIDSYSKDIFNQLRRENYLIGTPKRNLAEKLAIYMGDLNALHPFREGNGRTQRTFINYLANINGYHINFQNITQQDMIHASIAAFNLDYGPLEKCIKPNLIKIPHKEIDLLVDKIIQPGSQVDKIYQENKIQKQLKIHEESHTQNRSI